MTIDETASQATASDETRGKSAHIGAIDIVCNYEFADPRLENPAWQQEFFEDKIGSAPTSVRGFTPESFIEKMDADGIDRAMLLAVKAGSADHRIHYRVPYELVAEVVAAHPDRFSAIAGVDPTEGMRGLRALEEAVRDMGFIGAHLYPHWFDEAPDHRRYYPIYAKCAELGIPIQMQVGRCLRYSAERPLVSVGRPQTLDTIACDFPELTLIGIHLGWPWTEEMIAVADKHPNVYIGSDAYAPAYWPDAFVRFLDSWGRNKVIFGTDFPVIDPGRARREIDQLPIRDTSLRCLLRDNAIRVYGLPETPTTESP